MEYMPQSDQLFEWRTIWKNVLLGLEVQHKKNSQTEAFAQKLLKDYGLLNFKDIFPRQLSRGMRQRVALIRTLDYQTRLVVSDEVKQIIKKENKTTVLVTHDIAEAISMADRVVVLTQRPAGIKNIHSIKLSCQENTPLKCREAPEFSYYFNTIWKELEMHVR